MEQPLQRLSADEIEKELRKAEKEQRPADFSYKLIPEFSFSNKEISINLNFKGSTIQGAAYFDNCKINGDLILEDVLIYATLYVANSLIKGNFLASGIRVREVVNLVATSFGKNVIFDNASIKGFLGLNKVKLEENLSAKNVSIINISTKTGTIRGDIFLKQAHIKGSVIFEEITAEGLANLEDSFIGEDLNLQNSQIKENVLLTGTIIEGDVLSTGLECKNLIAHMKE
ncbi:hypothetical protein KKC63_02880 [Patescibacteria group bacterium]|nr:hypothetical protein [Patescibacteria group bacterium]MBU4022947.1 hypothetical protein [Patescibacteria group bacterium]